MSGTRQPATNLARGTIVAERVENASSLWAKFLGLMGRPSLDPGTGLWLPDSNGIHMMFMRFPIDVLFLGRVDADGTRRVVAIRVGLPPWRGLVPFVRHAHGVLELPVGAVEASATEIGDAIMLGPVPGPLIASD